MYHYQADVKFEESQRYGGLNAAFVKRVWAKRREAKRIAKEEEARLHKQALEEARQEELRIKNAAEQWKRENFAWVEEQKLRDSLGPTPSREIIAQVAVWHGLRYADLVGASRFDNIVRARFDAIEAVYYNCQINGRRISLPEIGRVFGGRDHTTILHALRKRGMSSVPNPLNQRGS